MKKHEFTVDNWRLKQTVLQSGCPFLYQKGPSFVLSTNETLRVNFIDNTKDIWKKKKFNLSRLGIQILFVITETQYTDLNKHLQHKTHSSRPGL
jgi:hypothetical protein